jgi:DNA (cytosine-5)-methyltransferase 1
MIENVKGLLSHDDGNTIKRIIHELNKIVCNIYKCLDSSKYGVPKENGIYSGA